MRYQHRDGETATGAVSLTPVRDSVRVDEDGVFEVDETREDFDDVHERLVAAGHEPLDGESGDEDDDQEDVDGESDAQNQDQDEAESLKASDFTEEQIVQMDRNDLRSVAAEYDDIDGNASADKLTEELIQKQREETGAD